VRRCPLSMPFINACGAQVRCRRPVPGCKGPNNGPKQPRKRRCPYFLTPDRPSLLLPFTGCRVERPRPVRGNFHRSTSRPDPDRPTAGRAAAAHETAGCDEPTHGRVGARSVTSRRIVSRRATCPLPYGQRLRTKLERLLVAVNDSANGRFGSRIADMIAGNRSTPTTVMHVTAFK
jgi:hypothetical protein